MNLLGGSGGKGDDGAGRWGRMLWGNGGSRRSAKWARIGVGGKNDASFCRAAERVKYDV